MSRTHRVIPLVVLAGWPAACSRAGEPDPLRLVRARVLEAPAYLASDPDRFDEMRKPWPMPDGRPHETLTRAGDGWLYAASVPGTCAFVAYLDASLEVRDVELFSETGGLEIVSDNERTDPVVVSDYQYGGMGLHAITRYELRIVGDHLERRALESAPR